MSFIAVDLKVIEVSAPGVSRALGLDLPATIGSLTLLWHRCWSAKSDRVGRLELRGYFQHPEAGEVLEAFGLLEKDGEGWRVKGADRYLRVTEQRQKAGRARAASAGRSAGKFAGAPLVAPPAADQRPTSGEPALTPNTEHRTPNTAALEACVPVESLALKLAMQEPPDVVTELRETWNATTAHPLPKWREGREKLAREALRRRPLEQWREVFERINASSFCRGSDGGWRADIDWALRPAGKKPETALKVLEGAFDDRAGSTKPGAFAQPSDWTDVTPGEVTL